MNQEIVICAGHEKNTVEKSNPRLAIYEHDLNVATVRSLASILEANQVPHRTITDKPLMEKISIINEINPVLAVDIHYNKAPQEVRGLASGFECWHYPGSVDGKRLAELILEGFGKYIPIYKHGKGLFADKKYAFLRKTKCPSVITEGLFYDREEEVNFLLMPRGFEFQARSVWTGIRGFLSEKAAPTA